MDANEATDAWYREINVVLDEMVPYQDKPMRNRRSPYITAEIKDLMHKRDSLARTGKKRILTEEEWEQLHSYKRMITSRMRRAAKEEGKTAMQSTDKSSDAWKFINRFMYSTSDSTRLHVSPSMLNDYFASVVTDPTHQDTLPISVG